MQSSHRNGHSRNPVPGKDSQNLCKDLRGAASNKETNATSMAKTKQEVLFERWMENHVAILHRVVNGFAVGADRSDLMQEVMLAVWKSVPSFRKEAKASTFIYRVSHNAAMTWQRTERRHRERVAIVEASLPDQATTSNSDLQDQRLQEIYGAIQTLPSLDRSLMLLSLDGLRYHEIASIHGLSESNVGARLTRIRKRLLTQLNRHHHE